MVGMETEVFHRFILKKYRDCFSDKSRNVSYDLDPYDELTCPLVFDGYLCWPETVANTTVLQDCPDFVEGFEAGMQAHKTCLSNGSWYRHPESNIEWSNYTNCVDNEELLFRSMINIWYIRGYTVSLSTLIISLIIFTSFKSLWCTRIKIHIQLFVSLSFTCVVWIIWYKLIIKNPNNIFEYPVSFSTSLQCIGLQVDPSDLVFYRSFKVKVNLL